MCGKMNEAARLIFTTWLTALMKKKNSVLFDQYFEQCVHYIHVKLLRTNTNIKIIANMVIMYNN